MFGYTLKIDRDFWQKTAATVVATAATAALTAGLDKLVALLSADPKYAAYAVVVTALVSAFSKRKG